MGRRTWTERDSEEAFALLGDRIILATQRYLRSGRRLRLQADLYTVDGQELSLAQVDALEVVAATGALRMHEIAARLGVDASTATRSTAPLVDLGLLARTTDQANRRYVVLECTTKGRSTARRISEGRRRLMRATLAPMEPSRRLLLAELLEEFIELTERQA